MENPLPKLVTFDGEARSGKGTVVGITKDYLRDNLGFRVMLIDAGQVFRVLVVALERANVSFDDPAAIDAYLGNEDNVRTCMQLVKDVYYMTKKDRDGLLYTNATGANSAKVGARPFSQGFKDNLLRKWLHDAAVDGYETVLLDGRALEETGTMLANEKLCDFVLGLYFVCDPVVGARRTLGYSNIPYDQLDLAAKNSVDELVSRINVRNNSDRTRAVQPIVPPAGAPVYRLPDVPATTPVVNSRPMATIDTSAQLSRDDMALPVAKLVAHYLTT